jgi:pimeloyl-ACP methyl ester carboxylesterase
VETLCNADDLAVVTEHLDLRDAVHVGHSTGGGEVVRYLARHGEDRVAKAVLISSVPPLMVQTARAGRSVSSARPADIPIVYSGAGPVCPRVDQAGLVSRLSGTYQLFPVVSGPRAESVLISESLWCILIAKLV